MKNKLGYLGLLGFAGILGYLTGNAGYYGFFGFFGYFYYFTVKPDELFRENVHRATAIAFPVTVVSMTAAILLTVLLSNGELMAWGLALSYLAALVSFTVTLTVLELKEGLGAAEQTGGQKGRS